MIGWKARKCVKGAWGGRGWGVGVAGMGEGASRSDVNARHTCCVHYRKIITSEPGKRSGKPCIRGLRINVGDVLGWLASGMTRTEILSDFPELRDDDITAAVNYGDPNTSGRGPGDV